MGIHVQDEATLPGAGLAGIPIDSLRSYLGQCLETLDGTASEALRSAPAEQPLRQLICLLRVVKSLGSRHLSGDDRCRLMDLTLAVLGAFATAAAKVRPAILSHARGLCRLC